MGKGRIISFGWTWPALMARAKVKTRRMWKSSWAEKFRAGDQCQAYDKVPYAGGQPIAMIELIKDPYLQNTIHMTHLDYIDEGFQWFMENPDMVPDNCPDIWTPEGFRKWKESRQEPYVIEFRMLFKYVGGL